MPDNLYSIYIVTSYETLIGMGPAVVAAESEDDTLLVLENGLKKYFSGPLEFRNRDKIIKTPFSSDVRGVIYAESYRQVFKDNSREDIMKELWEI